MSKLAPLSCIVVRVLIGGYLIYFGIIDVAGWKEGKEGYKTPRGH
jgi:hypothetical protein